MITRHQPDAPVDSRWSKCLWQRKLARLWLWLLIKVLILTLNFAVLLVHMTIQNEKYLLIRSLSF